MSFGKTVNLGNSIIGVSILAMPYCFVQSGLILSIILIVLSGFLTRLSCHFLLKSAFIAKRRSFELLVHDVLGPTGRFLVEVGLVGFLLGTCVAYFIMIGDLAPKIITDLFDIKYTKELRIVSVVFLSVFVALPLSLLKQVDSLTSLSLLSMILYSLLIMKLMFETTDKLMLGQLDADKFERITYWNMSGLLRTFPIFSMAMSCQTSLFEIFDGSVISDLAAIKRDNGIVKKAIYLCSFVYITVGLLGYMAFHEQTLYGNILLAFPPSFTTTMTKIGFIITLLMSFPLCLFPCRTSVHSLTIGKMRKSANFQQLPTSSTAITLVGLSGDSPDRISKENECDNTIAHKHTNGHEISQTSTVTSTNRILTNNQERPQNFTNNNGIHHYKSLLDDDESSLEETDLHPSITNQAQRPSKLYISDFQFRLLTVILIGVTIILSLMFPHIEFILGIIGSTAGTTVCFVLPAYTFIRIGEHTKTELFLARMLLMIGLGIFVFCSYSTIHRAGLDLSKN